MPKLLRMYWVGSAAAFALMIAVALIERATGFSHWHYNPLSGDRYQDLMEFPPVYRMVHTAAFYNGIGESRVAYPPLSMVVYALIYATGHPVVVYLTTATLWLGGCVWALRRALIREGIGGWEATLFPLTVVLASFPIAGLLQRGNIELFLWIFTALGVWAFWRGQDDAAAVLWALAAAMKLYPIVLLAMLLPRRKWRAFVVGLATFVGVSVASMEWLGPSIGVAWHGALRNVFGYQNVRAMQWSLHELMANHSAYHLAKFGAMMFGLPPAHLTLPYYAAGAVVLAWAFFGRLWKMPAVNQLLALTAFMVALPPVSYFYTLPQLYAPLVVLCGVAMKAERAGAEVKGLRTTLLLFLPLCASFMLFTFPRVMLFGGLVQGVLLIVLFGCAVSYRFEVRAQGSA
ncbi:MAG TPA: glycosyltransferase family 87 protein [Acidobacteriaceae bacterium]|nr:glycosyltransferase family 87 protein [Acidobacteriaceae bacterium]